MAFRVAEGYPDLALPEQYTHIPVRALRMTSRRKLGQYLNLEGTLTVCDMGPAQEELDIVNDYKGLAELVQFDYLEIQNLSRSRSPTEELLNQWTSATEGGRMAAATVGNLWRFLHMMERFDVLTDCRRTICNDCRVYEDHRAAEEESHLFNMEQDPTVSNSEMRVDETKFVDVESVQTGKPVHYNAFVSYSQEDSEDLKFVRELIKELEVQRGLKLFVPGRDDLPGSAYHVITAYLIEKRCDRVILVLSRSFLKSEACDFQLKFAHALAPGARSKKLIPVIQEKDTHIPRILKFLAVCDFSKTDMRDWVVDRLYSAVIAPTGPDTFYDDVDEKDEETRLQARRELENSIYPQSTMNCISFSPSSTASDAGFGSPMPGSIGSSISAISMESMPSISRSTGSQLEGSYSDNSLGSSVSDDTIVAEHGPVMPGRSQVIPQNSGASSSISQYFPNVPNTRETGKQRYPASPPQEKPSPTKSQKETSSGKSLKSRILGSLKGRTKKRNASPKEEKCGRVTTSQSDVMRGPSEVRRYNPGIISNEFEGPDTTAGSRVSSSSEEFVKLDISQCEGYADCQGIPCYPPGFSQSEVQAKRQTSVQEIPPGYRPTASEVVRKTKPEIPPKPSQIQRRSRSPTDEQSGRQREQSINYMQ